MRMRPSACQAVVLTNLTEALSADMLRCRLTEPAQQIIANHSFHGRKDSSKAICPADTKMYSVSRSVLFWDDAAVCNCRIVPAVLHVFLIQCTKAYMTCKETWLMAISSF